MRFRWEGGSRSAVVPAAGSKTLTFRFDTDRVWALHFSTAYRAILSDGRSISVEADEPVLRRG